MFLTLVLFAIGFIFLAKGADILVEGASSLAKKIGVSEAIIGLTVVAMGTTMPEFVVGLASSFSGEADIVIGNVIGSTIFNSLFILGLAAAIRPFFVKKKTISREIPFLFFSILAVFLLANDVFWNGAAESVISKIDGFILLLLFAVFLYFTFTAGRFEKKNIKEAKLEKTKVHSNWLSFGLIIGGAAALYLGGNWVFSGAMEIARWFNLSESFIGLAIIAAGTSLPELATAISAAKKGKVDIAVGDIVGANIINLLWVLGACSFVKEIHYSSFLNFDLLFSAVAAIALSVFIFSGRKNFLSRLEGGFLVLCYFAYLIYLIFRG